MLARTAALAACLLALAGPAPAAEPDPLDAALDSCLAGKAAESTAGMLDCTNAAAAGWDKRLNRAYGALMTNLDPASQALLRTAQRAWLEARAKDATFAAGPWRDHAGTLAALTVASARLGELRARVLTLEGYLPD